EHPGEVLPGMIPPGEEQRDPPPLPRRRHDAGGEQSRPFLGARRGFFLRARRTRPRQRQDLHAGVIVIKDFALRGLADQLFESGPNHFGSFRDDFTLGRSRQRNSQTGLQPLQSIPRNTTAVLQQRDHRRRAFIVLFLAHLWRRFCLVNLAAQVAAQTFQLVDLGGNRRLAHHSDANSGLFLQVHLSLQTTWAVISWLQRTVRDFDALGAPIRLGAISPVPRLRWILCFGRRRVWRRDLDPGLLQHLAGLLRAGLRQQRAELADRRVLFPDPRDQNVQRLDRVFQPLTVLLAQRPLTRPLHQCAQLFEIHFDRFLRRFHPFAPLRAVFTRP